MATALVLDIVLLMCLSWLLFKVLYPLEPERRVFALFGCTHKTLSMAIPLLGAMFEDDPRLGM